MNMHRILLFTLALLYSALAYAQPTGKTFSSLSTMTSVDGSTWFCILDGTPKVWKKFQGSTLRSYVNPTVTSISNGSALSGISAPYEGDLAINTAKDTLWVRDDAAWIVFKAGTSGSTPNLQNVLVAGNSANSSRITNLGTPISGSDATTKTYVDTQVSNGVDAAGVYATAVSDLARDTAIARSTRILRDSLARTAWITKNDMGNNSVGSNQIETGAVSADEIVSSGVTAGSYTSANITVDQDGRVTTASNGSGGGSITLTKSTYGDSIKVNGSPIEDNANLFNSAFINQNNLKWYPAKVYDQQAGTDDINIVLIGDSKTEFPFIPTEFKWTLQRSFVMDGNGYAGLFGAGFMLPAMSQTNTPTTAGWTIKTKASGGRGLNMYSIVSQAGSTAFTATATGTNNQYNRFTEITIYWWGQAGGGTFTLSIDAVNVGTINTSSGTGFRSTTITGFTDTFHNITITPISANAEILGISTGRGINGMRFHAVGQSGAEASEYVALDTTNWNPQLRALSPKLVCIHLGTNERSGNLLPAIFKTNVKALVTKIKVAMAYTTDICLFGIADNNQTKTYTTEQYNEILRQVANEDTLAFFDINKLAGKFIINKKKGDGWLTDGLHEGSMAGSIIADNFSSGLPSNQKSNTTEIFRQTFGFSTPVNATQTAGRILVSAPTTGTVQTSGNLLFDGANITHLGGNFSSAGTVTGTTALIAGSPYYAVGTLRHGGNGNVGYFGFIQNTTGLSAGYSQGIRVDGSTQTVRFFTTNQGAYKDNWRFEGFATGVWKDWATGASIIRQAYGFSNNGNGGTAAFFRSNNTINQTSSVRSTIKDHYWETIRNSMTLVNHISLNNKWGDNYFNSQANSTAIGVLEDTVTHHPTINRSAKLQIGGTDKGFLLPVVTTAQRDSIKTNGIQKIVVSTPGSGYTSIPTITINGGGGSFATTTAYLSGVNTLAAIDVLNPGRDYTSTPTVTITGGGGSGATATATLYSSEGLQVYNSTTKTIDVFKNGAWNSQTYSISVSATLDFPSTATLSESDLTITVTGAADGDIVGLGVVNALISVTGVRYRAWVSSSNTVTVRFNNDTVGSVDPASATFKITITK